MSGASLEAIGPKPLTPGEADALRIIQEFVETRAATPTRIELMREMGLRSTSGAQRYVEALVAKGWIARQPIRHHGIVITGNAIQLWATRQTDVVSVADAMKVFNMPGHKIIEAVDAHYWMFLAGPRDLYSKLMIHLEGE